MKKVFQFEGTVKLFPMKDGWVYLPVPFTYADFGVRKSRWGMVPAKITIGNTTWTRSILPLGKGKLFIALNKKVRKAEGIEVGDVVQVKFNVL